jgi:O-antigen/teichoic acid export membrane protein
MKNKYQRLNRKEKKQVVKDYINESEKNKNYYSTLKRMFLFGLLGLIYGVVMMIITFITPEGSVWHTSNWDYIVNSIVIIFTVFILVKHSSIKTAVLNNYLINKKDNKSKKK